MSLHEVLLSLNRFFISCCYYYMQLLKRIPVENMIRLRIYELINVCLDPGKFNLVLVWHVLTSAQSLISLVKLICIMNNIQIPVAWARLSANTRTFFITRLTIAIWLCHVQLKSCCRIFAHHQKPVLKGASFITLAFDLRCSNYLDIKKPKTEMWVSTAL